MKKILSVIAAASLLLGSTIAYANANETDNETVSEVYSDISEPADETGAEESEDTSDPAGETDMETYADTIEVVDQSELLEYTELEDGTLEVSCLDENRKKLTNVVIPSEVLGKKVTRIGYRAFLSCLNLASVTIPDSVTHIGVEAFDCCIKLNSIFIPHSVIQIGGLGFNCPIANINVDKNNAIYSSEDGVLFNKDKTTLIWYPQGKTDAFYDIPDGVTYVNTVSFWYNTNINSLTIPQSTTELGSDISGIPTFILPKLTNINVDENNKHYCSENGVLFNKDKTILIYYPEGKTDTSYDVPDGVTIIKEGAFVGSISGLNSITIPQSVTEIAAHFNNCQNLTSINVDENNENYSSESGILFDKNKTTLISYPVGKTDTSYIIPNGVNVLGYDAFSGCESLTSVTIPNSVTSIGDYAFFHCKSLTSVTIPNSVTSIGYYAFMGTPLVNNQNGVYYVDNYVVYCDNDVEAVSIKPDTIGICDDAFFRCENITNLKIPNGVKFIGNEAFNRCLSLKTLVIPDSVTNIGYGAFYNTPALTSITIPDSVANRDSIFRDKESLTNVKLSDNVTNIGNSAFSGCKNLSSVTFGKNVKKIGNGAFNGCENLSSIKIPDSVTNIGDYAFKQCDKLRSVSIPQKVTTITYCSFLNCKNLSSVTIPNSVTHIYPYAFSGCSNIKDVYYNGTAEQWNDVVIRDNNEHLQNAIIHYESTGSEIIEPPIEIEIPHPSENVPETSNAQVSVSLNGSLIDTIPINEDGTLDLSTVPDGSYTFTFSADNCAPRDYTASIQNGSLIGLDDGVELRLYGDVDDAGDGIVDIRDVAKANQYFKTGEGLSGYMLTVSDVNRDGVIDIRDVAQMNAHFKGAGNLWE